MSGSWIDPADRPMAELGRQRSDGRPIAMAALALRALQSGQAAFGQSLPIIMVVRENRQNHTARWRCRVRPRLMKGTAGHLRPVQQFGDLERIMC